MVFRKTASCGLLSGVPSPLGPVSSLRPDSSDHVNTSPQAHPPPLPWEILQWIPILSRIKNRTFNVAHTTNPWPSLGP